MIKKLIFKILNYSAISKPFLSLFTLSRRYLKDEGWTLSVKSGLPIDKEGKELPWFTYSIIHFLNARLNKKFTIFEYGSGNSTIWFSNKVKNIVSVEHDEKWHSRIKGKLGKKHNIKYIFKKLDSGEYQNEILNYDKAFDIIVIDGRQRIQCSMNSLNALKKDGVIIWDNSDRSSYDEGFEFLQSNGFKRIDFWGLGPINSYPWCTSIFYKHENCLDI